MEFIATAELCNCIEDLMYIAMFSLFFLLLVNTTGMHNIAIEKIIATLMGIDYPSNQYNMLPKLVPQVQETNFSNCLPKSVQPDQF